MGSRKVYVFSVIPRLAQVVQEALSDVTVIDMKLQDIPGKYEKKVSDDEVAALQEAEVLLIDNNLFLSSVMLLDDIQPTVGKISHTKEMVDRLPKLKWVQGTWAGVESLIAHFKDKPKPLYPVSRMTSETFSQLMAEYTLGWIISHERGWLESRQHQLNSTWHHDGKIAYYRSLQDLTVGVLGMGIIGKEVARSLKALRSTVHAYTRTEPSPENRSKDVDKYRHSGELPLFLRECDYIVNIMPSTPATRGLLGGNILSHAKKYAVLINVGRGDVISEKDLIKALDADWLSAAILDVYPQEPLPKDSPLWLHPKVVMTPHSAGVSRAQDVGQCFVDNYRRFINGQPVLNIINWEAGY